jgi:hypothetical protein
LDQSNSKKIQLVSPCTGQREHGGHNSARPEAAQQPGHSAGVSARRSDMLIPSLGGEAGVWSDGAVMVW